MMQDRDSRIEDDMPDLTTLDDIVKFLVRESRVLSRIKIQESGSPAKAPEQADLSEDELNKLEAHFRGCSDPISRNIASALSEVRRRREEKKDLGLVIGKAFSSWMAIPALLRDFLEKHNGITYGSDTAKSDAPKADATVATFIRKDKTVFHQSEHFAVLLNDGIYGDTYSVPELGNKNRKIFDKIAEGIYLESGVKPDFPPSIKEIILTTTNDPLSENEITIIFKDGWRIIAKKIQDYRIEKVEMSKYAILAISAPGRCQLDGYVCIEELMGGYSEDLPMRTPELCELTQVFDTIDEAQTESDALVRRCGNTYTGQRFVVKPVEHEFYIRLSTD
jgi:hypothetical protein